ncbi:MAG: hypothetical protein ACI9MR_002900 [Myxococcota bacterium]|jgi:hypothetical protein
MTDAYRRQMPPRIWLVAFSACIACAAVVSTAGSVARADLPTLPVPPPPPSASQTLTSQLAAALYAKVKPVAGATFLIEVRATKLPPRVNADTLMAFVTDTLEASLRQRSAFGARVGAPGQRADEVIALTLQVKDGHVMATATRRTMPVNVWERLRAPNGAVVATAFATVRIDLELRTLLGLGRRNVRLDRLRVVPVGAKSHIAFRTAPILDLAVVDLDGDRLPELVALQPNAVQVAGWTSGGFSRDARTASLAVIPRNKARVRRPIGRLVVGVQTTGSPQLVAATSDHASPVIVRAASAEAALTLSMQTDARWPLYALGPDSWVSAGWPRGTDVLDSPLKESRIAGLEGVAAGGRRVGTTPAFYDVRAFDMRRATSPSWSPYLGTVDIEGTLRVWTPGQSRVATRRGVGSAWSVADVDGDGDAEVLVTSAALAGPDTLSLLSVTSDGRFRTLWSTKVPHPVTALVCADVDRDGYREFIVATWDDAREHAELTVVVPRS